MKSLLSLALLVGAASRRAPLPLPLPQIPLTTISPPTQYRITLAMTHYHQPQQHPHHSTHHLAVNAKHQQMKIMDNVISLIVNVHVI